jgi:hypothetical protein
MGQGHTKLDEFAADLGLSNPELKARHEKELEERHTSLPWARIRKWQGLSFIFQTLHLFSPLLRIHWQINILHFSEIHRLVPLMDLSPDP